MEGPELKLITADRQERASPAGSGALVRGDLFYQAVGKSLLTLMVSGRKSVSPEH